MTDQIKFCCIATGSPFERTNQYPRQAPTTELDKAINVVLQKVSRADHRRTLTHDKSNLVIHFTVHNGVCFICIADSQSKQRTCWGLLDDMEQNWDKGAIKGSKGDRFLKERLSFFNDPSNDKLTLLNERVSELKDVMIENFDKLLVRGEDIEQLVSSTNDLVESAQLMDRKATKVKRISMWKLILIVIIILVVVIVAIIVLVLIIVAAACKGLKNCKKK